MHEEPKEKNQKTKSYSLPDSGNSSCTDKPGQAVPTAIQKRGKNGCYRVHYHQRSYIDKAVDFHLCAYRKCLFPEIFLQNIKKT